MPAPKLKDAFSLFWTACRIWWADWSNLVLICLLGVLMSLTVILAPIAYFGILQVVTDLSHSLRTGLGGFFQALRSHWKAALGWGFVSLAALGPLAYSFVYFSTHPNSSSLSMLLLTGFFFWIFFTLSSLSASCYFLQEPQNLSLAIKNAWALIRLHPAFILTGSLISLVITLLSVRYYLPILLGVQALLALFSIISVQRTLGKTPEVPSNVNIYMR